MDGTEKQAMKMAWAAVCVALCVAVCTAAVRAQAAFGGPSYDPLAPPVILSEAEFLARRSGMDESATQAAKSLTEAAATAIKRAAHRMQRSVERAHTMHPRAERETIVDEINQARVAQTSAHAETTRMLLSDLRALVPKSGAGDAAWAAFERRRNRRLYLPQSARVGTGVDLVGIAERVQLDGALGVRELLDAYEVELDRLLVARHPAALQDVSIEPAVERGDMAEAERLYNAIRDLDCAILRVQRSFSARLLEAAPAELRDRLRLLILRERKLHG